MEISKTDNKPRYCQRCNRRIDDAIREQVQAGHVCHDGACTFREEIEHAIAEGEKPKFKIIPIEYKCPFTIKPLI